MRKILVSFADKRYKGSLEVLKDKTKDFGFDERYFLTEDDLPKEFLRSLHTKKYRRGFGYWRWKPFVVKKYLDQIDDGDILVYSDGGTYWNIKGKNRFNQYIDMLVESKNGILTFQQPFLEKDWTKGDIFDSFGLYNDVDLEMSLQLWGGHSCYRKTRSRKGLSPDGLIPALTK